MEKIGYGLQWALKLFTRDEEIISLGFACQVKEAIDRNICKRETNFFDWLITDFQTAKRLLKMKESDFDVENFQNEMTWLPKLKGIETDGHKIEHKKIKMVSIHDIPVERDLDDQAMKEFTEKYKRRFRRLIHKIKTVRIDFIHCLDHQFDKPYIPTRRDIQEFFFRLNLINPHFNCNLHLVVPPHIEVSPHMQNYHPRLYIHYLKVTYQSDKLAPWRSEEWNWEVIFQKIKEI